MTLKTELEALIQQIEAGTATKADFYARKVRVLAELADEELKRKCRVTTNPGEFYNLRNRILAGLGGE